MSNDGYADYIGHDGYADYIGHRTWLRELGLYDTMEIIMPKDATMFHWDGLLYAKYIGQRDGPVKS